MSTTLRDRVLSAVGAILVAAVFTGAAVLPAQMATAATFGF